MYFSTGNLSSCIDCNVIFINPFTSGAYTILLVGIDNPSSKMLSKHYFYDPSCQIMYTLYMQIGKDLDLMDLSEMGEQVVSLNHFAISSYQLKFIIFHILAKAQETEDGGNAFSQTGALTIKSSSSSSGGLVAALGISRDNSVESNDDTNAEKNLKEKSKDSDKSTVEPSSGAKGKVIPSRSEVNSSGKKDSVKEGATGVEELDTATLHLQEYIANLAIKSDETGGFSEPAPLDPQRQSTNGSGGGDQVRDLSTLLQQMGLVKYQSAFEEQDVDLQLFLSLTDNDLKEIGIK